MADILFGGPRDAEAEYDYPGVFAPSSSGSADFAGGAPDLGEDILSLRMKAVRLAEANASARSAPRTFAADLAAQRSAQVDLSTEQALSALRLEDPQLSRHIDDRRAQAALEAEKATQLPGLPQLRSDNRDASRGLSAVNVSMSRHLMGVRCSVEEVLLEGENAAKLASGSVPHGYPGAPAPAQDRLTHLSKKLQIVGAALAALLADMEQTAADLTVARRLHDVSSAGLLQWAEASASAGPSSPS